MKSKFKEKRYNLFCHFKVSKFGTRNVKFVLEIMFLLIYDLFDGLFCVWNDVSMIKNKFIAKNLRCVYARQESKRFNNM